MGDIMDTYALTALYSIMLCLFIYKKTSNCREVYVVHRQYLRMDREKIRMTDKIDMEFFEAFYSFDAARAYYNYWEDDVSTIKYGNSLHISIYVAFDTTMPSAIKNFPMKKVKYYPIMGPNYKLLNEARNEWREEVISQRRIDKEREHYYSGRDGQGGEA
jgi:hypothetical protein